MDKKLAVKHIDFADSEYKFFQMSENGVLTVYLNSWDAKVLKIEFLHTIYFSYKLGNVPRDLEH